MTVLPCLSFVSRMKPTFGCSLNDFAVHSVPVLIGADDLELVEGVGAQVVDGDLAGVGRIGG